MAKAANTTLCAPDGSAIKATYDAAVGMEAEVESVVRRNGLVQANFAGETDTDTVWENQKTVSFRGEDVFVDENGSAWHAGQLVSVRGRRNHDERPLNLPDYNDLLGLLHEVHDLLIKSVGPNDASALIASKVSV